MKLKPCPHCGSSRALEGQIVSGDADTENQGVAVSCGNCSSQGPVVLYRTHLGEAGYQSAKDESSVLWNNRQPLAKTHAKKWVATFKTVNDGFHPCWIGGNGKTVEVHQAVALAMQYMSTMGDFLVGIDSLRPCD